MRKSNDRVNLIDMHGYFRPHGCYDVCSYNDWTSPPGSALHDTPEVSPEDHQDITGTLIDLRFRSGYELPAILDK